MISIYLKHQQKQFLKFGKPQESLQGFSLSSCSFFKPPPAENDCLWNPQSLRLWAQVKKGGWFGALRGSLSRRGGPRAVPGLHSFPPPPLTWWGQRCPSCVRLNITQRLPDPSGLGGYLVFFFLSSSLCWMWRWDFPLSKALTRPRPGPRRPSHSLPCLLHLTRHLNVRGKEGRTCHWWKPTRPV